MDGRTPWEIEALSLGHGSPSHQPHQSFGKRPRNLDAVGDAFTASMMACAQHHRLHSLRHKLQPDRPQYDDEH